MEGNVCDINHLDADVLLPPRKRLLAGLKKQSSDVNCHIPLPSTSSGSSSEFDIRLNNLLKSHLSNPSTSTEEIVEASKLAAAEAIKVARAARAAAEEKAIKAAKAVAAAKRAMELVANVSEDTSGVDKYSKKNKLKKQVPVQLLYNKPKGTENCKTDEELARKLHRAINSSPRISKTSSASEVKNHRHKKLKSLNFSEKASVPNSSIACKRNTLSLSNGNNTIGDVNPVDSGEEGDLIRVDLNKSNINKAEQVKKDNCEAAPSNKSDHLKVESRGGENSHSVGESVDDIGSVSKKRGRLKQKKLPLSICSFRDQASPREDSKSKCSSVTEENMNQSTESNKPSFSVGTSGETGTMVERSMTWKCQSFKAPACVKQNKVVQS